MAATNVVMDGTIMDGAAPTISAAATATDAVVKCTRPLPVTLLSGFLGSGKTSLLKHILVEKDHKMRVAVIVNEITSENLDVVALQGSKLIQSEEKVVEMSNGCICCTLRLDLVKQLSELQASGLFDAALIESSGIAEPMEVAESFFVPVVLGEDGELEQVEVEEGEEEGEEEDEEEGDNAEQDNAAPEGEEGEGGEEEEPIVLQRVAPLDNCITVVDASTLLLFMSSETDAVEIEGGAAAAQACMVIPTNTNTKASKAENDDVATDDKKEGGADAAEGEEEGGGGSKASVAQLLFDQLEFANIVILNKVDLLSAMPGGGPTVEQLSAVIRRINPTAEIIATTHGTVPISKILHTGNFTESFAKNAAKWMRDEISLGGAGHVPETQEYGISSCLFKSFKPFHPKRLHDWLTQYFAINEAYGAAASSVVATAGTAAVAERERLRTARYGRLFRGKGYVYIGSVQKSAIFGAWSQTGNVLNLFGGGYWETDFPEPEAPKQATTTAGNKGAAAKRSRPAAPRPRQLLSFVGQDLKAEVLRADLTALLMTEAEVRQLARSTRMAGSAAKFMLDASDPFVLWTVGPEEGVEEEDDTPLVADDAEDAQSDEAAANAAASPVNAAGVQA